MAKGAQKKEFNINKDVVVMSKHVTDEVTLDKSELVFAGYGVQAPELNWDDFRGVDVKGKTIVVLVNDPPVKKADGTLDEKMFGGKAMTYYGRWTYKYEKAAELGAAGVIIVHETEPAAYQFSVVQNNSNERFNLVTPDKNMSRAAIEGWISFEAATEMFKMAGQDYQKLKALAATRDFKPVPLGMTASVKVKQHMRTVDSQNVVAKLTGSDPALKNEFVTYTAHWDHLGRCGAQPGGTDEICNGAADNASGTAMVMEIARAHEGGDARAQAFDSVPVRHRRRAGAARIAVLRRLPAVSPDEDVGQHQHRRHQSVGTDEGLDGDWSRRFRPG